MCVNLRKRREQALKRVQSAQGAAAHLSRDPADEQASARDSLLKQMARRRGIGFALGLAELTNAPVGVRTLLAGLAGDA